MAVKEHILDFIGERYRIFTNKKEAPKQPMKFIRAMTEDGWRPVTLETPIPHAPQTINALIVRCCSADPSARPSFEEILTELGGQCKTEIEASVFKRHFLIPTTTVDLRERASSLMTSTIARSQLMRSRTQSNQNAAAGDVELGYLTNPIHTSSKAMITFKKMDSSNSKAHLQCDDVEQEGASESIRL